MPDAAWAFVTARHGDPWHDDAMSARLKNPMSLEAFLDRENRQELRYEFDGFAPAAMTGGSMEQSRI